MTGKEAPYTELGGYLDIRATMSNWEIRGCWNCENEWWERLDRPPKIMCRECFMGQRGTDHESDYVTPEGYTDYRKLWYGDVSIEEAKRRYLESTKGIRERRERERGRDREVTLLD